jgi:hypothetical protein
VGEFGSAIQHHLELQRRNRMLEPDMPLAQYRDGHTDPVSTAIALEDTQEWTIPDDAPMLPPAEELWSGTPAFEWGD